ncbi:hypothetical protein EKK58_08190 [Candidatus Dependentiae bacterium]|nr:MAG: hypothetical protein EKK58_08190 [Candidatus Dependentiae bacterium]
MKMKLVNWLLDTLMFIVPILELSELMAIIPVEYLPYYMLATVILRRALRLVEEHIAKDTK